MTPGAPKRVAKVASVYAAIHGRITDNDIAAAVLTVAVLLVPSKLEEIAGVFKR